MDDILVTGGTGFLGFRLCERLLEEKHRVTVVGRNEAIGDRLVEKGANFVKLDLRDEQGICEACSDRDYVFHSGALSTLWGKYKDFYDINVKGTANVVKGCMRGKVGRLIHVSTPGVYFDFRDRVNIKESDPLPKKMVNHYAATKLLAELEIAEAHRRGLPVVSIRPRAVYGPRDSSIFPRLARANERFGIPVINGGRFPVDISYVDNVVDALILCATSGKHSLGKFYNITNGEPVIFYDILSYLFQKMGRKFKEKPVSFSKAYGIASLAEFLYKVFFISKEPAITKYSVGILSKAMTLNISAARRELGYVPRVSNKEGLDRFVSWWKKKELK